MHYVAQAFYRGWQRQPQVWRPWLTTVGVGWLLVAGYSLASSLFSIMFIVIVFVMKDGAVEAAGTPDELLKTNEYYKMFVKTL